MYELVDPTSLELHATAMLCLPSGECMLPDATLCTALTSALYSSVSNEVVNNRQLQVCSSPSSFELLIQKADYILLSQFLCVLISNSGQCIYICKGQLLC